MHWESKAVFRLNYVQKLGTADGGVGEVGNRLTGSGLTHDHTLNIVQTSLGPGSVGQRRSNLTKPQMAPLSRSIYQPIPACRFAWAASFNRIKRPAMPRHFIRWTAHRNNSIAHFRAGHSLLPSRHPGDGCLGMILPSHITQLCITYLKPTESALLKPSKNPTNHDASSSGFLKTRSIWKMDDLRFYPSCKCKIAN